MLTRLMTRGENGIFAPDVTGKYASSADKSTSRNERMPARPAIHKITNSLVLKFIQTLLRNSVGGTTVELTSRGDYIQPSNPLIKLRNTLGLVSHELFDVAELISGPDGKHQSRVFVGRRAVIAELALAARSAARRRPA